ncbi:unnamed protein product [Mortierella alpina]
MPKPREFSLEERREIVGMKRERATNVAIAAAIGCSTATVQRTLKKARDVGALENLPRSGRPRIFKERDLRELRRVALKDRHIPLRDITNQLSAKASTQTVRKELHNLGFESRIAAKKPFLTQDHMARR